MLMRMFTAIAAVTLLVAGPPSADQPIVPAQPPLEVIAATQDQSAPVSISPVTARYVNFDQPLGAPELGELMGPMSTIPPALEFFVGLTGVPLVGSGQNDHWPTGSELVTIEQVEIVPDGTNIQQIAVPATE